MTARTILTSASVLMYGERLRRRLGDTPDVEDAIQNVGEKLVRSELKPDAPYLVTMLRNAAIDTLRAEQTRRKYEGAYAEHRGAEDALSPENASAALQSMDALHRALDDLSPVNREIFLRAYVDGQPRAQIAEILGLRLPTIEKRLAKAKRHCLERLAPYLDAP
ncbi:MAG: sigma-70 family RNA polymerase sigma factor [Pseudomonadota bacterium]